MNIKTEFLNVALEQTEIALATSVNDVSKCENSKFYFDPAENMLFHLFKENDKNQRDSNANPPRAFTHNSSLEMGMLKLKGQFRKVQNYF